MTRTALILGGSGFIAGHLIPKLRQAGWLVHGTGRSSEPPRWLNSHEYSCLDLTRIETVELLFRRVTPDVAFLLAGTVSGLPGDLIKVNSIAAVAALEAVRRHVPACTVIVAGSAAEYGVQAAESMPIVEECVCKPRDAYGLSKLAATEAALAYHAAWGVNAKVLRMFNVVGAGMPPTLLAGALLDRIGRAMRNETDRVIPVGRLDTYRDFVAVDDVVSAMMAFIDGGMAGQIYNICSGKATAVRAIADQLIGRAGAGLRLAEDSRLCRPDDVLVSYGSHAKASATVGYVPHMRVELALDTAWESTLSESADLRLNVANHEGHRDEQ